MPYLRLVVDAPFSSARLPSGVVDGDVAQNAWTWLASRDVAGVVFGCSDVCEKLALVFVTSSQTIPPAGWLVKDTAKKTAKKV
jgi:hypothetical protein